MLQSDWFLRSIGFLRVRNLDEGQSEHKVLLRHVDGPGELVSVGFVVDFLYRYPHVFTPVRCEGQKDWSLPCTINIYHHVRLHCDVFCLSATLWRGGERKETRTEKGTTLSGCYDPEPQLGGTGG